MTSVQFLLYEKKAYLLKCLIASQVCFPKILLKGQLNGQYFTNSIQNEFDSLYLFDQVCLTGRSLRRHTWILMGPDYKACWQSSVYGSIKREKRI